MARRYDPKTSLGGPNERFRTTDWTNIRHAQGGDEAERRGAMATLVGGYWKPIYCFLRRRGRSDEEAKDLTQGFFQEVVLGRRWLEEADRAKGRFRSFLMVSLDHYARSVHRAGACRKRRPEKGLVPLEGAESFSVPEPAHRFTPEEAFHRDWAAALLGQVIADVERQCRARGEATHWEMFAARVLRPILDGSAPPPMADLCARLGVARAARASNMIVTVKRRFRSSLENHVRPLVASDAAVAEEIDDLMAILARTSAGS
jgi:RNA polymerase sigma-70 factor (ECF subfamily)